MTAATIAILTILLIATFTWGNFMRYSRNDWQGRTRYFQRKAARLMEERADRQ